MSPTIYLLMYPALPIKDKMQRLTRQNKKIEYVYITFLHKQLYDKQNTTQQNTTNTENKT
jgi:hypothetical protein